MRAINGGYGFIVLVRINCQPLMGRLLCVCFMKYKSMNLFSPQQPHDVYNSIFIYYNWEDKMKRILEKITTNSTNQSIWDETL